MNNQQIAQKFITKYADEKSDRSMYYKEYATFSNDVKSEVAQIYYKDKRKYLELHFSPDTLLTKRTEVSLSGKYTLKISSGKYSQGLVYNQNGDVLFEVQRNYWSFPFLFIENHSNGHDYLVCAEDYQTQTVLELDTGERKNFVPNDIVLGFGFCWSAIKFNPNENLLIVDGCIWAAPYEFRLYDFSDPMSGWPELEVDGGIDSSNIWPTFESDGTIKTYQSDQDDEDNLEPIATTSYKRNGLKLNVVDVWVSEAEQIRRKKEKDNWDKHEIWIKNFKVTDPLYLSFCKHLENSVFTPYMTDYITEGITYEKWCPGFSVQETRICRRIYKNKHITIDFEWAAKTGPVKLIKYKDGKILEDEFFMEHSVDSIDKAISTAKEFITQEIK